MDKLKLRQVCFLFAAVLPLTKLFIYPSTLAYYAKNDLLLSCALNYLLEGAVVALVLWLASRTRCTLFELFKNTFGRTAAKVLYLLLAAFLLFSALLPMLEQKNFVMQVLYENVPSLLSFAPFFAVSCFACTKGLKTLGRIADAALPVFAAAFPALILLALPHADFATLAPAGAAGAKGIFTGSLFGLPWFCECLYPLLLLGHFEYEKGGVWKGTLAFAAGAGAVLLLLAVFYGIFEELAVLTQYPLAHIAKYTTVFTTLGRADFLFLFAMALLYIFALCVPLQLSVHCVRQAFPRLLPVIPAAAESLALLVLAIVLNYSFNAVQTFAMRYTPPLIVAFCYLLPLAALFLRRTPKEPAAKKQPPEERRARRKAPRPAHARRARKSRRAKREGT